jgi:hypothetical protein
MPENERKMVLAVDADGTLLEYDGWKGEAHYGKPIAGMVEVLQKVRDAGWIIVIWTTRGSQGALRNHLAKHKVPFDHINKNPGGPPSSSPKIFADVYLDDRAIRFEGETDGLADRILTAVPWFEVGPKEEETSDD